MLINYLQANNKQTVRRPQNENAGIRNDLLRLFWQGCGRWLGFLAWILTDK